ncbi:hypothetical protein D3C81_1708000 [compost metagenome]
MFGIDAAVDTDLHVRMLGAEALQHRRQQQVSRPTRGADAHHAVARAQHLGHLFRGLARLGGDQARPAQERLAEARQHHAARGAGQKWHVQLFLELADALGDGRRRYIARLGPGANAAAFRHGNEILQLAQTHDSPPPKDRVVTPCLRA